MTAPRLGRYGLFGTRITHLVLGHIAHTKKGQPQPPQAGGTQPSIVGEERTGSSLRLAVLPILGEIFGGNYGYVVFDAADPERRAIAVDAADPEVILRFVAEQGLTLTHVLTTHWHWDHSGGNRRVKAAWPEAEVVGGAEEGWRVPCASRFVRHADDFAVAGGALRVRCHGLRGHTRGSICYEVSRAPAAGGGAAAAEAPPLLFTGDALFVGGCGALFERSAALMYDDLGRLFSAVSPDTLMCPGHEYTLMLLTQAASRLSGNEQLRIKLAQARAQRGRRAPTVPSRLGDELGYNLWVRAAVKRGDDFSLFCQLCGAEPPAPTTPPGQRAAEQKPKAS